MLSAGQVGLIKGNTGWESRAASTEVKGKVCSGMKHTGEERQHYSGFAQ